MPLDAVNLLRNALFLFQPGPYKILENAKVKDLKNYESNSEAIDAILGSHLNSY